MARTICPVCQGTYAPPFPLAKCTFCKGDRIVRVRLDPETERLVYSREPH